MALEVEHPNGFGSDEDLFAEEELESFSEPTMLNVGVPKQHQAQSHLPNNCFKASNKAKQNLLRYAKVLEITASRNSSK